MPYAIIHEDVRRDANRDHHAKLGAVVHHWRDHQAVLAHVAVTHLVGQRASYGR
jgi:hypothetical protein